MRQEKTFYFTGSAEPMRTQEEEPQELFLVHSAKPSLPANVAGGDHCCRFRFLLTMKKSGHCLTESDVENLAPNQVKCPVF